MPNMADITVKNAANADVIYVKAAPSPGDKLPAIWTQNAASTRLANRPRFSFLMRPSQGNGQGAKARRMESHLTFPVVEMINGVATVTGVPLGQSSFVLPTDCDWGQVIDAFTQWGNLHIAALIRAAISEGYAPT